MPIRIRRETEKVIEITDKEGNRIRLRNKTHYSCESGGGKHWWGSAVRWLPLIVSAATILYARC